jgi:hypothetical protein
MKIAVPRVFHLTIAKKLFLGFLSYGILTILIALSSLQHLNQINNRITERDVNYNKDRIPRGSTHRLICNLRQCLLKGVFDVV